MANTKLSAMPNQVTAPTLDAKIYLYDGAPDQWAKRRDILADNTAWTAWTPTLTNMTLGSGTVTAKYKRLGTLVRCRFHFVLGAGSGVGTNATFTLPTSIPSVAVVGTADVAPLGEAVAYDQSAGLLYEGKVLHQTTSTAVIRFADASGTYSKLVQSSSSTPFTWASPDELALEFSYECAP